MYNANNPQTAHDIFNRYAPQVVSRVLRDEAYRNARANSDEQNTRTECNAAVNRVVVAGIGVGEIDLLRAYADEPGFKEQLQDYVFENTYSRQVADPDAESAPYINEETLSAQARREGENGGMAVLYSSNDQVRTVPTATVKQEPSLLHIGAELTIDGRRFAVDSINPEFGSVSLRDVTFQNGAGFPIFRKESIEFILDRLNNPIIETYVIAKPVELNQTPPPRTPKRKSRRVADGQQSLFDLESQTPATSHSDRHSGVFFPGEIILKKVNIPQPEDEPGDPLTGPIASHLSSMGWTVSDELVSTGITEFQERTGKIGAVEEIADFIQNEYLAEDKSDVEDLFGDDNGDDGDTDKAPEPPPIAVPPSTPKPPNFRITDDIDIGGGGAKTKYKRNIEAIRLLKTIEAEGRYATPDEQRVLALYAGWGGIPQTFDTQNADWRREYSELKELLSEKEYRAAAASTLNAHYTTPEVIGGIYAALERFGFSGGNVLEPALGVGNFYGCMPEEMALASRLYGVELDSVTGRIARQLYPNADIQVRGFENAELQDNFFDCAVSNVPFGAYKVSDPRFDKYGFLIHDYFFGKALDKVRPGGVIAFVTSKGTMDKANASVRRYLAERAEFLGAIRLPNTAFKRNAGTEVTTDIIFLKKRDRLVDASDEGSALSLRESRPSGVRLSAGASWIHIGKTDDGVPMNEYYIKNPHMMLGTMAFDSSMYGGETETTLNPDGRDLRSALYETVEFLSRNSYEESGDLSDFGEENFEPAIPADPSVKNYCHAVIDGKIYQRVDSAMAPCTFAKAATERVAAMIEMRSLTRHILTSQLEGISDEDLAKLQRELNAGYDKFYKKFGALNSRYNSSLFGDDADYPLLAAIEETDDDEKPRKAAQGRHFQQTNHFADQKDYPRRHADGSASGLPQRARLRGHRLYGGFVRQNAGGSY
ncbi:MAG: hypothetical protein LBK41_00515 [Clostridiales bacterium]|nr:hypothetical protein [Clostridiales bacterium]